MRRNGRVVQNATSCEFLSQRTAAQIKPEAAKVVYWTNVSTDTKVSVGQHTLQWGILSANGVAQSPYGQRFAMGRIGKPIHFAGSSLSDRAHICAFFNSTEDSHRVLLPFISEGLEAGEKTLHTIDPKKRDDHIRWLNSAGIDVVAALNQERLEILDWTESHLRSGRFDQQWTLNFWEKSAHAAKNKGFPLVRFVSEMEWVLETDLDPNELLEYEAKANDASMRRDGPVNPAICVYDLKKFRGDIVMDVMRTHPLIIVGGVLQNNSFFVPPEEFLNELRARRTDRNNSTPAA